MSATALGTDKHFFLACYSLRRVRSYIPLVVSSPIDIEVMTSPHADWELPNQILDSPASPDAPTRTETTTATTIAPLDGATEPEASSLKLNGNADPELCGYGVRASPVSVAPDADTDSLPELRVKATVSSLQVAGASMGDPRSPSPPTAKWAWSSDEDDDDANRFRGFMDDCADAVVRHVRRAMNTPCMAHVENEVRAGFGTLMRKAMEPAFVDEIIKRNITIVKRRFHGRPLILIICVSMKYIAISCYFSFNKIFKLNRVVLLFTLAVSYY